MSDSVVSSVRQGANLAHIDWLSFTVFPPIDLGLPWLVPQLKQFLGIPGLVQRNNGWNGYDKSYDMASFGLLGCGGIQQHGTIHVSVNAKGCARVPDWQLVQAWGETIDATITRVDLAHDDLDGKTITIELALAWYRDGQFDAGGRSPSIYRHGDWDNLREGRTVNIGKRTNGKLLRIYEKGKQLGDPASPWTRAELELRKKSRHIPWDVVTDPTPYLAGAYPCLGFLSVHQEKIRTIQKSVQISLQCATEHARTAYGKLVNVLMHVHRGDAIAVVNELNRPGVPRRLAQYSDFVPPNSESDHENA